MSTETLPKYRLFLLSLGHFGSDFYMSLLAPLLPFLVTKLGLSLSAAGILILVQSLTGNILQPFFGYYIDKSRKTWLILLSVAGSGIFFSLLTIMPNLPLLTLFLALGSTCSALFHPLGSTLVASVTPEDRKSFAMSMFIGGGNFGFALAPAAITYLVVHFGLTSTPVIIIPGLVLTALFTANSLHTITPPLHPLPPVQQDSSWYRNGDLVMLNLVMGLRSWMQVAIPTFVPLWLASRGGDPLETGQLLTVFLFCAALGGLVGGYVADRLGTKTTVMTSLIVCIPLIYMFLTLPTITLWSYVLLGLSGASLQSTMPCSIVWAQQLIPRNAAMASGMMLGLSFGIGGLGTTLTGFAADHIGIQPALLWSIVSLGLAAVLALFVKNAKAPEQAICVSKTS